MHIFAPIIKRDDEKRMVYGYASTEALDSQGERVSKAAIEEALPDYMKWANVREMHQASAVGVTKSAEIDEKGLYIQAKIVDDSAWEKVKEGVYKGFSIGGKALAKVEELITKLKLGEISLVDRPANAEAVIELWKAETPAAPPIVKAEEKAAIADLANLVNSGTFTAVELLALAMSKRQFSDKKRKELADKGHALPDGSFPIENTGDLKNAIKAFGRAKDKKAAKAHIIARAKALKATNLLPDGWSKAEGAEDVRKGLYQVSWLANLLDTIACLHAENAWEQTQENDDSPVPEQLEAWLKQGAEILEGMVAEECAELMGVAAARTPDREDITDKESADSIGDLLKNSAGQFPVRIERDGDHLVYTYADGAKLTDADFAKGGAKFSKDTKVKLDEAAADELLLDELLQVVVPSAVVEDAWDWSQDETLEETLDFDSAPVGAAAPFAQFFGEDAEQYLEDENAADELLLDEAQQAIAPSTLVEDAWPWWDDAGELDELQIDEAQQPAAIAQPPEDPWDWSGDYLDEETLDSDGPPVGTNAVRVITIEDAWPWADDDVGDDETPWVIDTPTIPLFGFLIGGPRYIARLLRGRPWDANWPVPRAFTVRRIRARTFSVSWPVPRAFTVSRPRGRQFTVSAVTSPRFDTKLPGEEVVLTFDFTPDLLATETLTGTPTVASIVVSYGTDPTPTEIENGALAIDSSGKKVLMPVQAGLDLTDYDITVQCTTSNTSKVLELLATLPVRAKP